MHCLPGQKGIWMICIKEWKYISSLITYANHKFLVDSFSSSIALQFDAYQIINVFCFFLIAGYQNALNRGNFVRHLLATFSDL